MVVMRRACLGGGVSGLRVSALKGTDGTPQVLGIRHPSGHVEFVDLARRPTDLAGSCYGVR